MSKAASSLLVLSGDKGRWPRKRAIRAIWRAVGGSLDELAPLLELLLHCQLVEEKGDTIKITVAGSNIAEQSLTEGNQTIGLTFVRAGFFHDQARAA